MEINKDSQLWEEACLSGTNDKVWDELEISGILPAEVTPEQFEACKQRLICSAYNCLCSYDLPF